jgi:DNA-binding NtrC family response regulator
LEVIQAENNKNRMAVINQKKHILIVDDDEDILIAGELLLKRHFGKVSTCNRPEHIPVMLANSNYDVILLDMNFSSGDSDGAEGLHWLKYILDSDPDAIVVMITAHARLNIAIDAMKFGATDFIAKPWQNEKVIATLSSAIKLQESRSETAYLKKSNQALVDSSAISKQTILGQSTAMAAVHSIIRRSAPTDANVIILGENGTGKELVARELHQKSLRSHEVFMSVDLGAVSESLFESELFGHTKGAFTGANSSRIGRLVAANKGTLFLDEISNIPLHLQAKLLTVLEQRKVTPLGSNQPIDIDVRVIAATNLVKEELLNPLNFRQDLLFRLNTVEIVVPPLRERKQDIEEIALYYAHYYATKYRKSQKPFSDNAIKAAQSYSWPGNVRALRHAVERAVILCEGSTFEPIDLQLDSHTVANSVTISDKQVGSNDALDKAPLETSVFDKNQKALPLNDENLNLEVMEKRLVEAALRKHGYNISNAAKELGLTRATLYRRIEKYGF